MVTMKRYVPEWNWELFVLPSETSVINSVWVAKKIEEEVLLAQSWKEWLVVYQVQVWKCLQTQPRALQMPIAQGV